MDGSSTRANDFLEQELDTRLATVGREFEGDAICINSGMESGLDDFVRSAVEALRSRDAARPFEEARLALIVTTPGGYIGTVQRIVETIRHHYRFVSMIIPNYAYSAGTILAMSGDEIWMDYYSRLGPIDPQVMNSKGRFVPALGYLRQWERLEKKAKDGTLTSTEAAMMLYGFDLAELYQFEQAAELSVLLLKRWLVAYKFKEWTTTQTRGRPVTTAMKNRRAVAIAKALNDTDRWKTHGHGISMSVLREDLKLMIDDLSGSPARYLALRNYYDLLLNYMSSVGHQHIIHFHGNLVPLAAS